MYGEVRSWKRNNNPLLRAKDIFRRHPQKNILNQIYLFHILWMTYNSHVGSLGKEIWLGKELKWGGNVLHFIANFFQTRQHWALHHFTQFLYHKKAWYRSMSYISWILFCCCKILKTKCMQQSKTSPEVPTKRRSIYAWNMDEERRKQEMDDEVKKRH